MEYKIQNVSDKNRFCEDKLVEAGKDIIVTDEKYVINAKMSPSIFDIREVKKSKKVNE